MTFGTVATTDAAKSGPHSVVWSPMNRARPMGTVKWVGELIRVSAMHEFVPGRVKGKKGHDGERWERKWGEQSREHTQVVCAVQTERLLELARYGLEEAAKEED